MGATLLLSSLTYLLPVLLAWLMLMLGCWTWLKGQPTPLPRASWTLYLAVLTNFLVGAIVSVLFGLYALAEKRINIQSVNLVHAGVALVVWVVLAKLFFPRAAAWQLALTVLLAVALDALLSSYLQQWLLGLRPSSGRGA